MSQAVKCLFLTLAAASLALAAVDGIVVNATTGKAQAGATVTLFQPTSQGPQFIESVKTDAQGKFQIVKEVPAGPGPLLLQAVYSGVQYNKMLPPGSATAGVQIPVYEASKKQGDAKIDQHMILLEPSADGNVQVSESYVFKNEGKSTWNDPENGTLQFALPAGAQGKVEVNAVAPGGMPLRKAPDPGKLPNTFKLDFPVKPGESRVDLQWSMPFRTPGIFTDRILTKGGNTRIIAPVGVTFKGDGLKNLGQEPRTQATIWGVDGPDIKFEVQGTGTLSDPAAGGSGGEGNGGQPALGMNLPKLYGMVSGSADLVTALLAVKWVMLSVLGMLVLGFVILYRKGDPIQSPDAAEFLPGLSDAARPDASPKASKHARGRG